MKRFSLIIQSILLLTTIIMASIFASDGEIALTILYCYLSWLLRCCIREE